MTAKPRVRMPGGRLFFIASMAFLVMQAATAADFFRAQLANPDQRFHEVHEPEVNVSGNVIVGVMAASVGGALLENSLAVRNPTTEGMNVCLKVTSRDGAYRSENEYRISAPKDAAVQLPYRSGMKKILDRYSRQPGSLAAAVTRGNCAQAAVADFLVPAELDQQRAGLTDNDLTLLVNGFDATDVFYHVIGTPSTDFRDCRYIEEGRHTAFNFICDIPTALLDTGSPLRIEIGREIYGRELEPLGIEVWATP